MIISTQELAFLKPHQISVDSEDLKKYSKDWTNYFDTYSIGVVFPEKIEDLQQLVHWARKNKIALVPSGGRTGLSGGAVAINGELIVSMEKLRIIDQFNPLDGTVRAQAGVITEELQKFAQSHNLFYPVDFASRGSSHIGGNIATNAGGIKVLRYGLTRDWIMSLTVVTGLGEVLHLNNGLIKNATGYDLRHLFIGSEGTLGFIFDATIRLAQPPPPTQHLLVAVPDLDSIMRFYNTIKSRNAVVAYEMFSDVGLRHVLEQKKLPEPFSLRAPYYVLTEVEVVKPQDEDLLMLSLEEAMDKGWVLDGSVAQNESQVRTFWRYREDITESVSHLGPYKNDISVCISKVSPFIQELDGALKKSYPSWEVIWFGHIGDGNLHISILKPREMSKENFYQECQSVDQKLFEVIKKYSGSISAEHGVGLTKKKHLHYTRSESEITIMKSIKKIFDPDQILNPGKLLDM